MWSVKNEAQPFELAAVAAAREQMLTVCNVPASAETMLDSQTTSAPLVLLCSAVPATSACRCCKTKVEGTQNSCLRRAFDTRFSRGHAAIIAACPREGPEARLEPVHERGVPSSPTTPPQHPVTKGRLDPCRNHDRGSSLLHAEKRLICFAACDLVGGESGGLLAFFERGVSRAAGLLRTGAS
jgi:hypothetical protein